MDHDQRFKTLIRDFFVDFMQLFFGDLAARMDLTNVEWLDKEVFQDPPDGSRHALDLVARLPVTTPVVANAESSIVLIHVEIESPDRTTLLKPRLPYYYHFLRDKYQLPVLPIVIYLKVGWNGIGTDVQVERFWDLEVNQFKYLYVGLPGLDAIQYLQGDNWLGVALSALMSIPRDHIAWLGAEALRRLAGASLTDQQRFLLGECVEAYLPLDAAQALELDSMLKTETYQEVKALNKTTYERGIEQGIERGIEQGIAQGIERGIEQGMERGMKQGRIELVKVSLAEKFGAVPDDVDWHLEQMKPEELGRLILKIGTAASLTELGLPEADA